MIYAKLRAFLKMEICSLNRKSKTRREHVQKVKAAALGEGYSFISTLCFRFY